MATTSPRAEHREGRPIKLFGSIKELVSAVFRKDGFQITLKPKNSTYTANHTYELPDFGGSPPAAEEIATETATQTLQNKELDDDTTTIRDTGNPAKIARFQVDAAQADGTINLTLPDTSGTLALASEHDEAGEIGYTPNESTDWDVVPSEVAGALDELAQRTNDDEDALTSHTGSTTAHDAADLVFGPTTPGDWNTSPVDVEDGLDELAGRVKVNEGDITVLDGRLDQPNWDQSANLPITTGSFTLASEIVQNLNSYTTDEATDGPLVSISGSPAAGDVKVLRNDLGGVITIQNGTGANQITTGTGLDLRLADDASVIIRFNGTAWEIVGGAGGGGGLTLSSIDENNDLDDLVQGFHYLVDTSVSSFTVDLPTGAAQAVVRFSDVSGTWGTNNLIVRDSSETELCRLDVSGLWVQFMWNEDTSSWVTDDPIDPALVSGGGMETSDTSSGDVSVGEGRTRTHYYLTIAAADTYTIGGRLIVDPSLTVDGSIVVNGSLVINNTLPPA